MALIKHVLCPVDFSDVSQHALYYAAAIARRYEARLTVLHVFANLPSLDLPPLVLDDLLREYLMTGMQQMAAGGAAGVPVDYGIREAGHVDEEILSQVIATSTDLLVLGTHGRSGFQHLFLGSITEKVMRSATCATLVVPPRAFHVPATAPIVLRQILCPVDFSRCSRHAVTYALQLAETSRARLTLLHVVELPHALGQDARLLNFDNRNREAAMTDARRKMHELTPEHAGDHCRLVTAVVEGRAHREVLRHAADRYSDLIVMGVHGRGELDLLVFGSTTHHVIRESSCPVLIVRCP